MKRLSITLAGGFLSVKATTPLGKRGRGLMIRTGATMFIAVIALPCLLLSPGTSAGERCTIRGTVHPDRITGTPQRDGICAGGGNDFVDGKGGADRIFGGEGDDHLKGGLQADLVSGGRGRDVLGGSDHVDVLRGGRGADALNGGNWRDTLVGGPGRDFIDAVDHTPGADTVRGGAGHDICLLDARDNAVGCEEEHAGT